MAEAVTAPEGIATIAELPSSGMITLRGDLEAGLSASQGAAHKVWIAIWAPPVVMT